MLIKYIGGRTILKVGRDRKYVTFSIENNRTVDVTDADMRNYIFGLPNRQEFEVVESEKELQDKTLVNSNPLKCEVCGFIAKSDFGKSVHARKHLKQGE